MKKYLLIFGFFLLGYAHMVSADWAAYSPLFITVDQSKCMQAGLKAGKTAGIPEMTKKSKTEASGMNKDGYSIQFICLADRGMAFYIINGSFHEKRQKIAKMFYSDVKKNFKE
jgi:hypothetical protein